VCRAAGCPDPAAPSGLDSEADGGLPYIQCVPYARQVSGIQLHGDALTWWDQAAGRYARGTRPRVGAVMAFRPYGAMHLGHVAAVSRIVDQRTVLLRHANWSPIDGRRGQMEDNVRAVDVSPDNDWSEVRVWYAPLGGLGTTHWPVAGFIYNRKPSKNEQFIALASVDHAKRSPVSRIGSDFLSGIVPEVQRTITRPSNHRDEDPEVTHGLRSQGRRFITPANLSRDPIGRIIARAQSQSSS